MEIIDFNQVSKAYKLGNYQTNLRETLVKLPQRIFNAKESEKDKELFWALDHVSFKVEKEEVVGIIGHNGAGKSTILKLLSKVTYPTSGTINIKGRVAALIELGAGFHPDLSGRENVYLNASVLGLKRKEVDEQFNSIVQFAELERFIDTPIKRYSSGMYVRLAFAVAAHIKADVLLIDEVLSVGDMSFQQKSMAKMNELRNSGTTIVFISHNLSAIKSFCDRVYLLNKGKIEFNGPPQETINKYKEIEYQARRDKLSSLLNKSIETLHSEEIITEDYSAKMSLLEIINSSGVSTTEISPDEPVSIRCHFQAVNPIYHPVNMLRVRRRSDNLICFTLYNSISDHPKVEKEGVYSISFKDLRLTPGVYTLEANIHDYENWEYGAFGMPLIFTVKGGLADEEDGIYAPQVLAKSLEQKSD